MIRGDFNFEPEPSHPRLGVSHGDQRHVEKPWGKRLVRGYYSSTRHETQHALTTLLPLGSVTSARRDLYNRILLGEYDGSGIPHQLVKGPVGISSRV